MVEGKATQWRLWQSGRVCWGSDTGLFLKQFGKTRRRAGAAQDVAVNFGQRPESAGGDAAVQHERGDGPSGHTARGDISGTLPDDEGDRAEHQHDDDRGHDCAEADAALGGGEDLIGGIAEPLALARFLTKRLDDLHRAENFIDHRANIGDAILAGARHAAHAAAEYGDRHDDQRQAKQHHAR